LYHSLISSGNKLFGKDFHAIEMMRSIRLKLQDKYEKDPNLKEKRLLLKSLNPSSEEYPSFKERIIYSIGTLRL